MQYRKLQSLKNVEKTEKPRMSTAEKIATDTRKIPDEDKRMTVSLKMHWIFVTKLLYLWVSHSLSENQKTR